MNSKKIGILAGVGILGFVVLNPIYFVQSGEKAVIKRFGVVNSKIIDEGMHLKTPMLDEVLTVNVRPQTTEGKALTYTKDNQPIDVEFKVLYNVSDIADNIVLYRNNPMGNFASSKIMDSIKSVGGKYTASDFVTKREKIRLELVELAKRSVINSQNNKPAINIIDIPITNVDFDDDYERAIKSKQVMQQEAQKKEYEYQAAQREAQITVAKAEAEAKALTITAQAIAKNPSIVRLEEVKKWNGIIPLGAKTVISGDAKTFVNTQ